MSIVVAIGVLAFLIFIHELGHFTFAKLTGVYVEKFSLGFGPKIFGFKYGETEYLLSALPFGGYCAMYGEMPGEETVDPLKKGRAFTDKARWQRALIALGGPLFNILLAVVIFWILFASGIPSYSAKIGLVKESSPAAMADIQIGDTIVYVDDINVKSWVDFSNYVEDNPGKELTIILADGNTKIITADTIESTDIFGEKNMIGDIGVSLFIPPIIGAVVDGTAAAEATILKDDKFLSIGDTSIASWYDSRDIIRANPNKPLDIKVERDGNIIDLILTPKVSETPEGPIGLAGINPIAGDIIVKYDILDSLRMGFEKSYEFAELVLTGLVKIIKGTVPADQIGGPIMIVQVTASSAQSGIESLLIFLSMISVNLAVFNLLPLPVLDGGQILILAVEGITRRKINDKILAGLHISGWVLLIGLMIFAFYNDIMRIFS